MSEAAEPSLEQLAEAIRKIGVGEFLLSMASTLASIAFGKLESGDLAEARTAIDALAALTPFLEGDFQRDLNQAVANLKLAYAGAAAPASSEPTE